MPCLRSIIIKNPAIKVNHSKPGKKIGGLQECSTTGITMHLTVFCAVSINWSVEILGRIGTPCLLLKAVVYGAVWRPNEIQSSCFSKCAWHDRRSSLDQPAN